MRLQTFEEAISILAANALAIDGPSSRGILARGQLGSAARSNGACVVALHQFSIRRHHWPTVQRFLQLVALRFRAALCSAAQGLPADSESAKTHPLPDPRTNDQAFCPAERCGYTGTSPFAANQAIIRPFGPRLCSSAHA